MRLLQLKFGRVFAGDDALMRIDIARQAVEQRRLARARTAGDDDVAADAADDLKHRRAFRRDRAKAHELVERQLVLLELTNGKSRAIDGQRRRNDVDARAVGKTGVADRARFIDAAADLAHDALADGEELAVVTEADVALLHLAIDFDEGLTGAIDHDVGDVVARQKRLERTEAQNVVADVLEQLFLLGNRHREVLDRDDIVDDIADFLARALIVELGKLRQVDRVDERGEDLALGIVIFGIAGRAATGRRLGRERRRRCRDARRRRLGALAAGSGDATITCGSGAAGAAGA